MATGRNYEDLKFSTIISPQALGKIIPETCAAIYSVLREEYLKVSKNCNKSLYFNVTIIPSFTYKLTKEKNMFIDTKKNKSS